jgi:thioredoxin-dependent peroxiredoxin
MSDALAAGSQAPDFTLPTDGSGTLKLSSMLGKKVVVYFYPKDDTTGCTAEAIAFNGLKSQFEAANTAIIGISADSAASHAKFRKKYALDFALASDEKREALEAYGVWVEKSMYGKKYMGIERSTFLIDSSGKIAKAWNKVKVPGHADEVLAATKAI